MTWQDYLNSKKDTKWRYPRTRYKSTAWRKDAWKNLGRMNWKGAKGLLRNALRNFRTRSHKVGWTARTVPPGLKGPAHAFQQRWRKQWFMDHGRVV